VSKDRLHQKKHSSNHRSQQSGIIQTEEGLVSVTEREEWNHLRRPSNQSRPADPLIGGISTNDHYQTTSQRQMNGVKTSSEQLTLMKQPTNRKVINDPAQATAEMRYRDNYATDSSSMMGYGSSGGGGNGYGYKPQGMGGSLIKNMGSTLLSRVEPPSSSGFSSSSSHKTPSAVEKTLISENFNSTPGSSPSPPQSSDPPQVTLVVAELFSKTRRK
jgi:hypothetical protein